MSDATDWPAAVAILAAGLILGLLIVYAMRRRTSGHHVASAPIADLQARRDLLLQQIRTAGDTDERMRLERLAANVLRELDEAAMTPAVAEEVLEKSREAEESFFNKHPVLKGYILGAASAGALVLIVYYGFVSARPRDAGPAGGMGQSAAAPAAETAAPPDIHQLEKQVNADPDNVDNRMALTRAYFGRNELMAVFEQTKLVLARHPEEPRALTYNAVVRMAMGQFDDAQAMLERATRIDPALTDAWIALASVHSQAGRKDAAAAAIAAAIAQHPDDAARLNDVLANLQAQPAVTRTAHPERASELASVSVQMPPPGAPRATVPIHVP